MSHLYGLDWKTTLRNIAGGGSPEAEARGSQPAPPPAGLVGPPADQGSSLVAAGATSNMGSTDWQAAASAVDLPVSETGEFQEPEAQEERDDAFSEGSWVDKSSQDLRAMLRHFRPGQDDAVDYESLLTRVASVLALRGEPLDSRMLSRFAIRASYAQLVVGMSSEEAGTTLRAAFGRLLDEQPPCGFRAPHRGAVGPPLGPRGAWRVDHGTSHSAFPYSDGGFGRWKRG